MYIAGRLRTASIPPRTLMEVASYLWPPVFPAAASFSAMGRASPQIACGCNFATQHYSCGKAVARMCPTLARRNSGELPCPLVSLTRSWVRILCRGRVNAPAKLEGLRLHPVPFRKIRGDAAELFHFPLRKGDYAAQFWLLSPWRRQAKQRQIRAEYGAAQKEF